VSRFSPRPISALGLTTLCAVALACAAYSATADEQRSDDTDWTDCLACHAEQGSSLPPLSALRQQGTGPLSIDSCLDCHARVELSSPRTDLAHPIRPLAAHIACTSCHLAVPHSAAQPPPRPAGAYDDNACLKCHGETRLKLGLPGKHGAQSTGCIACHAPHQVIRAPLPLQLLPRSVADDWSGGYSYSRANEACLRCHLEITLLDGKSAGFATLNTVNYHGLHVRGGECLCIECHEPHGTFESYLLRSTLMTGEAFNLRRTTDGANCTVRCHNIDHDDWPYRNRVL
jgi:hypothetical protein